MKTHLYLRSNQLNIVTVPFIPLKLWTFSIPVGLHRTVKEIELLPFLSVSGLNLVKSSTDGSFCSSSLANTSFLSDFEESETL